MKTGGEASGAVSLNIGHDCTHCTLKESNGTATQPNGTSVMSIPAIHPYWK